MLASKALPHPVLLITRQKSPEQAQQESKSVAQKAFVLKQGRSLMFTDPGVSDVQFT